jgi:hypothetical protein
MNITALKAALTSLSFRARLHGAMRRAIKNPERGFYVKNAKGNDCLRVRWDNLGGFQFCKGNTIFCNKDVYKLLRA